MQPPTTDSTSPHTCHLLQLALAAGSTDTAHEAGHPDTPVPHTCTSHALDDLYLQALHDSPLTNGQRALLLVVHLPPITEAGHRVGELARKVGIARQRIHEAGLTYEYAPGLVLSVLIGDSALRAACQAAEAVRDRRPVRPTPAVRVPRARAVSRTTPVPAVSAAIATPLARIDALRQRLDTNAKPYLPRVRNGSLEPTEALALAHQWLTNEQASLQQIDNDLTAATHEQAA